MALTPRGAAYEKECRARMGDRGGKCGGGEQPDWRTNGGGRSDGGYAPGSRVAATGGDGDDGQRERDVSRYAEPHGQLDRRSPCEGVSGDGGNRRVESAGDAGDGGWWHAPTQIPHGTAKRCPAFQGNRGNGGGVRVRPGQGAAGFGVRRTPMVSRSTGVSQVMGTGR